MARRCQSARHALFGNGNDLKPSLSIRSLLLLNPNRSLGRNTQIAVYYCPFHARAAFFPESCRRNHLAVALFSASLSKPSTGCFLHTLTSLTLLWLGRASELSLLSKITLLPFGRDVTFRNVHQRCGQSARNVTKDESIESELSMPRPSNVMEHNKY